MPYIVLPGEREVIAIWGFRRKCQDMLHEVSTPTHQKASFVWRPVWAANAINIRNSHPWLCWMKEQKQVGLQKRLFSNLCALAGQVLFSRQALRWAIPAHFLDQSKFCKVFLDAFSYTFLCHPKRLAVSLCSLHALVRSAPPALPQQASPVMPGESAACPAPQKHPLKGGGRGQVRLPFCFSDTAFLKEHMACSRRETVKPQAGWKWKPLRTGVWTNLI